MITYCPMQDGAVALEAPGIDASSEAARSIGKLVEDGLRHLAEPKVEALASQIQQVLEESSDTAEGRPVDAETAAVAIQFAYLLPWSLPTPEVAPDADGEISFDWLGSSGKMFSVTVDKTGRIAYAGRFGSRSKVHGIEQLSTTCPQEIVRGIKRATY